MSLYLKYKDGKYHSIKNQKNQRWYGYYFIKNVRKICIYFKNNEYNTYSYSIISIFLLLGWSNLER